MLPELGLIVTFCAIIVNGTNNMLKRAKVNFLSIIDYFINYNLFV